jgi:hypothetical protein
MSPIAYQEYETIPKGRISALNYKTKSKESTGTTRRRKGSRLTQKKKSNKVTSPAKKVESGMNVGTKYFIEDTTRRSKDLKTVYAGTYVGTETIGDNVYLNFKGVKIIVNPFGKVGLPKGFSQKGYKFIEQI